MNIVLRIDNDAMGLNLGELHSIGRLFTIGAQNYFCNSISTLVSGWCEKAAHFALSFAVNSLLLLIGSYPHFRR